MVEYDIVSWDMAYNQTYYLFEKMINDDYYPDIIVGIARGGWIPARLLADFYGNRFTANIKIEFYEHTSQSNNEPIITQELTADVSGRNVLIVDDVADSGKSLKAAITHIEEKKPNSIRSATLHYKPHSIIKPEYYVGETKAWIVYPWEYGEFIAYQCRDLQDKMSLEEIQTKLKDIGIPPPIVETYFSKILTHERANKI